MYSYYYCLYILNRYLKNLQTNDTIHNSQIMLDLFYDYFKVDGYLLSKLSDLIQNYNKTILWRDIAPTSYCDISDTYEYHNHVHEMNAIAQHSLKQIGVIIIPHIWEKSLPYWKLHHDGTHYCTYQLQSVENVWIKYIIQTIMKH